MTPYTAWPDGAAFLHDLCFMARTWCAGARPGDRNRVFATLRAHGNRQVRWGNEGEPAVVATSFPTGKPLQIEADSAHALLQAKALSDRIIPAFPRFVVEGARLPGLHALGLCPGVTVDLVGGGEPQGALILHNADIHPDPTWRNTKHPLLFEFSRKRPMEEAVKDFLATVALIEAYAPGPDDPHWVFVHPAGQYKERLDWVGGPIQARDEQAALVLARATIERAIEKEGLQAFQRPRVEGMEPPPKFVFEA
jgi:hypothetical protein